MVYRPQFNPNIHSIQAIERDQKDDSREGQKRRVLHQGRAWSEEDNDLPLQPSLPQTPAANRTRRSSTGVYADRVLLERAHSFFNQLTTLEEKAAQLCFLITDAVYDSDAQHAVELIIQTWQIGGILFQKGEYRRQAYLIKRYLEITKTPLLFANDYLHGLSFYLQGDRFPSGILSLQHYLDMGKAVMVQNRSIGIHIQFDRERGIAKSNMLEEQAKAFRKGIRGAHGIVGKEKADHDQNNVAQKGPFAFFPFNEREHREIIAEFEVQETIGFKTLTFFDATLKSRGTLQEELLNAFKQHYDVFLLSNSSITEAIRTIARLVRNGHLSEEVLDRHVMKALIIKSLFFK